MLIDSNNAECLAIKTDCGISNQRQLRRGPTFLLMSGEAREMK
jgi:hypothetical protein